MIRLILVRHGQSTADVEPRCIEGSGDFPLTDLGRRQAAALGAWLSPRYAIDQIISSPLQRAQETAAILSAATGAPFRLDQRLAERSSGRLAGLEHAEADRLYPRPAAIPVYHRAPGGESYLDQYRRVADFHELHLEPAGPVRLVRLNYTVHLEGLS